MADYLITCVRKDNNDNIIEVGLSNGVRLDIQTLVYRINNHPEDNYWTTDSNRNQVRVYARVNSRTGRWYATTSPDGRLPNNLDYLPEC